ncbi:E3 ubiquitin-protein ligase RNF103 isoform X2 [Pleuronectes platessa]|uniref:E3 ubiquitin-protein ligase RNF103 isoform X2 n=1 Tax=Pleuronectes platessa TaxID=8262 RepID=UPI00232A61E9|nr:E3 ubiquitin-protein ligase RNF103 isoform X2 [Pleuronectes platessa]
MWLKLFFLLLYFIVLFMLARIFEAVAWYETGTFATQLVDPVTLSYKRLKTILECRGMGYSGLVEKVDVSDLVEKSGELTQGELYSAIKKEKEQTEPGEPSNTHFSGEMHFYELVEDTKDGIWLVQVIAQDREALLSKSNWAKMVQRVSQFGIRTGTFNCSNDNRTFFTTYHSFFEGHVSSVAGIAPRSSCLFPRLQRRRPPVFFSSLSIKFTGRIEFIFVDVRHWSNDSSLPEIGVTHSPAYILKMPEGIYRYGNSTGEFLSLAAMDTFLRSVQPEVNDLFVLSLVLINLLAWMDLFITQGATVKRFVVLIRTLGTYNSILLVSWLPVLALLQLPHLDTLYGYSLKLLRYADTTTLASLVRADWTFYSSHPALFLSTYLAHGLLVDYFEKKRRFGVRSREDSTTNLEWLASLWEWYTSFLLHPITSLQQIPSDHSDWEDDSNFLFERLSFPDLWLHPLLNVDYIKDLSTWRFSAVRQCRGGCSGGQQHEETERLLADTGDSPPACPSTLSHWTKRYKRSLCSQDSSIQLCVHSNMDPCSNHQCVCDRATEDGHLTPQSVSNQHLCNWPGWPCDMLHCSECVVCLENFVSDELLMGLPCGHAFHQQCIVVWLATGQHCCPVCRWPSFKKKLQRGAQLTTAENTLQD